MRKHPQKSCIFAEMMKRLHTVLLLIAFCLMSACNDISSEQAVLDTAESLLDVHADFARSLLDSIRPQVEQKYVRRLTMRYRLLMASALNKTYGQLPSDTAFSEVVRYYDHHGNSNERMRAHYLLGCIYRDMGEAPQAIQCYQDATEYADTLHADCDYKTLARVYGQMADLFQSQNLPLNALAELDKMCCYSNKAHDTLTAINSIEARISSYHLLGNEDSVLFFSEHASKLYARHGDTLSAIFALAPAIKVSMKHQDFEKASKYIKLYESAIHKEANPSLKRHKEIALYAMKGQYYQLKGQVDSALYYLHHVLGSTPNIYYRVSAFRGLFKLYQNIYLADSAFKYAELYNQANDSTVIRKATDELSRIQNLYNYNRNQLVAEKKTKEAQKARFFFLMAVLGLVIVIVIALITILYVKWERRRNLAIVHADYVFGLMEYEAAKSQLKALKEESACNETLINEKQLQIKQLENQLSSYQEDRKEPTNWRLEDNVLKHPIVVNFHKMATVGITPSYGEWKNLFSVVDKECPIFISKIEALNVDQYTDGRKICVLIYLRFLMSEISSLLGISSQVLTNRRERMNEKMFAENKSAKKFNFNIMNLA